MQETQSSNPPVVTGTYDQYKSHARHHIRLKPGLKLSVIQENN